jgi:hypothetical protein
MLMVVRKGNSFSCDYEFMHSNDVERIVKLSTADLYQKFSFVVVCVCVFCTLLFCQFPFKIRLFDISFLRVGSRWLESRIVESVTGRDVKLSALCMADQDWSQLDRSTEYLLKYRSEDRCDGSINFISFDQIKSELLIVLSGSWADR